MTANIVPIPDNVRALRGGSLNQPPTGARRRTSNLMVIAAVTTTTRTSAATHMRTANYFRRDPGSAGSLNLDRELQLQQCLGTRSPPRARGSAETHPPVDANPGP